MRLYRLLPQREKRVMDCAAGQGRLTSKYFRVVNLNAPARGFRAISRVINSLSVGAATLASPRFFVGVLSLRQMSPISFSCFFRFENCVKYSVLSKIITEHFDQD